LAGSNDLNMVLKAQVVKLKVELDAKGSKLPSQVSAISKMLANSPVKLKVKLDTKDIKSQITSINNSVSNKPLKLKVELDTKGATKQVQEMYKSLNEMNKKYAQQTKKAQEQASKTSNVKITEAPVGNFNNIQKYLKQMEDAERILRSKFQKKGQSLGDVEGIFSTRQLRDAQGNLNAFVAELKRADGVVEKVRYNWNKKSGKFELIDRTTLNETQKALQQAEASLNKVKGSLNQLKNTDGKIALLTQFDQLKGKGDSLTRDMVKGLQEAVRAEQQLQQATAQTNKLKSQQAKIVSDIEKARAKDANSSKLQSLENMAKNGVDKDGKAVADLANHYRQLAREVQVYNEAVKKGNADLKASQDITKQRLQLEREVRKLQAQTPANNPDGMAKKAHVDETMAMVREIATINDMKKAYEQLAIVRNRIGEAKSNAWMDAEQAKTQRLIQSLKAVQTQMKDRGMDTSGIDTSLKNYAKNVNTSAVEVERALSQYQRMLNNKKQQIRADERSLRLGEDISAKYGADKVKALEGQVFKSGGVDAQTIASIQRYVGEVEKAKVASVSFGRDGVDAMGNRMRNVQVTFAGTGEHVRRMNLAFAQGTGVMRQSSDEMVRNVNRNLGAMEKLKAMMSSAPMWMLSQAMMTAPIQGLQAMTREILEVDKAMTSLNRVAGGGINTDILFGNAVGLSKELGNNIHDILDSMGEFARTFGDFNERQLTDITKTATLMSNVSDLKVQDAQASLVGTMNAFNIEAGDSIQIVDKLNQVDNDYAISTQQLATSLQKSASTAKTYGVSLEENIGHTTAIGAVTMESGNIIGNSLKAIYSRITGLKASESTLKSVGVEMYEMGENGKELRDVGDILNDLGANWGGLTAQQQQNTAVTLAGRNHLTRFLALMNNYDTALKATVTAYQSQGSAMRENEKYMQSMEAKINQMKNSFTTMSVAFGKAFMSDGIIGVVELLGGLLNVITQITQASGGLALVGATIATIMVSMGKFSGIQNAVGGFFSKFTEGFRNVQREGNATVTVMDRYRNGMANTGTTTSAVGNAMVGAGKAVMGFGLAFGKAILSAGAFGLAFAGIGWVIEKVIGHFQKLKAEQEAVERTTNKMVEGYRKNMDTVGSLTEKYQAMSEAFKNGAIEEGTKEYDEFLIVQSKLAEILPTTVDRIDANGQSWLKNSDEVKKALELSKQLSEAKSAEMVAMQSENIEKQTSAVMKMVEEEDKLLQKRKEAEEYRNKATWYESRDEREANYKKMILDLDVKGIQLQAKKAEGFSKMNAELTKYARAGLEASGAMTKLSDGAQKAVDNFMKVNTDQLAKNIASGAIEGAENIQKAMDNIVKGGTGIGETFAKEFERLSAGIDTSTNKGKTKVEELKKSIGQIGQAIPERFMNIEKFGGDMDKMQSKMKEFIALGLQIQKDGGQGFDGYVKSAEKLGLKTNEAKAFVMNLGKASENAELKAKAASEAQSGYADAVGAGADATNASADALNNQADAQGKANNATLEAIDLQKTLYGYKNEEVNAIKSNLEGLKMSEMIYGENAKKTQQWGQSVTELSNKFGVSRGEIEQNIDKYYKMADAMGQVKIKIDENGNVVKDYGSMTKDQISTYEAWIQKQKESGEAVDVFTGKVDEGKYKFDEYGNKIKEGADKTKEAGDKINEAGDKAKEGGDKTKQAGDSVAEGAEKIGSSGQGLETFMNQLSKLGEKSGQTGQQVLEGLQKVNTADFSQVQAKSSELGISMDKVVEYAKVAGSVTPEEMAKIGNSAQFIQLLDDKLKNTGFEEFKTKTGEVAEKAEADMQRTGNSGAPLSILEQKMRDLGFDEFKGKTGEVADKTQADMARAGGSGVQLAPLGTSLRATQDAMAQAGGKTDETAQRFQVGFQTMGNAGGGLAPLKTSLDETKGKMDETKTNVETNVGGINTAFSNLGQGINQGFQPFKTSAQLFTEQLQGMSKQSGTSAQEIQGHVTTIGNAKNALDQYKIAVDNVKTSMSGMATEVTGTATGLSQFGMAFAGAGQAMSGFQTSMSAVRTEMSNVVSQASGTAQSLQGIGDSMSNAGNSANTFTGALNSVGASCSIALQSMLNMASASSSASQGLASATEASNASAQASNNNANAKGNEANASNTSAQASNANATAKQAEANAIMNAITATQNMSSAYGTMAQSAISSISSIIQAIRTYLQAVLSLGTGTMAIANVVRGAFSAMQGSVAGSTGAMISAHNSQASALNKVKDSANQAKSAVQGLNSTISGAMSSLNNYIAKAQQASNVQVKAPTLPQLPTGASWNMSTINNITGLQGGEVASAVASAVGAFSASSGESGTAGGGSGTSGTLQPSIYSGLNAQGNLSLFRASADDSDKLADAMPWKTWQRSMSELDVTIKWMETKMKNMNKYTAEYRKMMNDVYQVEIKRWELLNHDLWDKERRNEQIKRELEGLKNINAHTKDQREQYNKLMQEYESNLSSIQNMRAEWQDFLDNWENRYAEILKSHVEAIVEEYTKGLEEIKAKVDDIDFEIDVAKLVDPDNMTKMMNLYIDKANKLKQERAKLENQQRDLMMKLYEAEDRFGKDSQVAKDIKAEVDKVKEAWEDSTIAVLQAEKEIKDARADVADDGIGQLKDYYGKMKDMAVNAIQKEQDNLKKAHDEKMKLYDKEIDKINKVYDAKFKEMDKEKETEDYQKGLNEKNAKRSELQNKISILSRDNSLEGKKKVEELKKELAEVDKELAEYQKERQRELMKQALEEQKQAQLDEIENKKKTEQEELDGKLGDLDKTKEDVTKQYDDLLNNDKYWADMRNEFIEGSFKKLADELAKMKQNIDSMNKGIFDGLYSGFNGLSDETKKQIAQDNGLVVDNMDFNSKESMGNVQELINAKGYQTFENEVLRPDDPARPMKPAPEPPPPTKPQPPTPPAQMPSKGNVTGVDASSYLNIRNAPNMQGGVIRRILNGANVQILGEDGDWWKVKFSNNRGTSTGYANKKYIKAFDTGGYTGDWQGNEGKMALLHKKEQVLNADDTKNLFDTVKLMDKVRNVIPALSGGSINSKLATAGSIVNISYGDINVTVEGGDKKKADAIAGEIMKGMKKKGR